MKRISISLGLLALFLLMLAACAAAEETAVFSPIPTTAAVTDILDPTPEPLAADRYAQYEMVTLLPRDAIPAIDNPKFHSAAEANDFYDSEELIIGVVFNGEARAYSVPFLSSHEIVNDTVGGVKIAVTW